MFSAKIKQNITKPNLTASKDVPKGGGADRVRAPPRAAGLRGPHNRLRSAGPGRESTSSGA